MKVSSILIVVVVGLCWLQSPPCRAEEGARVFGHVTHKDGPDLAPTPLKDATVYFTSDPTVFCKTNENGYYQLLIPPGAPTFSLVAQASGYAGVGIGPITVSPELLTRPLTTIVLKSWTWVGALNQAPVPLPGLPGAHAYDGIAWDPKGYWLGMDNQRVQALGGGMLLPVKEPIGGGSSPPRDRMEPGNRIEVIGERYRIMRELRERAAERTIRVPER